VVNSHCPPHTPSLAEALTRETFRARSRPDPDPPAAAPPAAAAAAAGGGGKKGADGKAKAADEEAAAAVAAAEAAAAAAWAAATRHQTHLFTALCAQARLHLIYT
jgi:hypothetical protein